MKTIFKVMALFGILLLLTACPKENCPDGVDAVLRDYAGLDGCRWVLELADGQVLEPVNLHDMDLSPQDNLLVRVSYTIAEDMMSICMVGPMVEIQCISPRQ